MEEFKNFENITQKQVFLKFLKRFGVDLFFLGIIIIGVLWSFGVLGKTNHHFACDAEEIKTHNRKNFFHKDGNYFTGADLVSQDFVFDGKSTFVISYSSVL